jgi:hypothetical protein
VQEIQDATGFELLLSGTDVPETAPPSAEAVHMSREGIDPEGARFREFPTQRSKR